MGTAGAMARSGKRGGVRRELAGEALTLLWWVRGRLPERMFGWVPKEVQEPTASGEEALALQETSFFPCIFAFALVGSQLLFSPEAK